MRLTVFLRWAIIWARMLERALRRVDWIRVVVRGDLPEGNGIMGCYGDDAVQPGLGMSMSIARDGGWVKT